VAIDKAWTAQDCAGEMIDGIWHGCGCDDCAELEADEERHQEESGRTPGYDFDYEA
jgi:hypothetical protein